MNSIAVYIITVDLLISVVNGQECGGVAAVGSLVHGNKTVQEGQTFILAEYAVPCNGTVIAWEFCYQRGGAKSVTFYPGIWRANTRSNGTDFKLIQSNNVTFTPNGNSSNSCQRVNLSTTDQFTVPAGSVVGLYFNMDGKRPLLLHNDAKASITAYTVAKNRSHTDVNNSVLRKVNYNIAIKVYLSRVKCINLVNVQQKGTKLDEFCGASETIVPNIELSCNGRITGYLISLKLKSTHDNECDEDGIVSDNEHGYNQKSNESGTGISYPVVQIWRRPNVNSSIYNIVTTLCLLSVRDIRKATDIRGDNYYLGNVSCARKNRTEFQSGDVIGYKYADGLGYRVWSIETAGYKSYHTEGSLLSDPSFNLSDDTVKCDDDKQPLIQLIFDIRCDNLSTPANGEITSCSFGKVGVGYEGDTCSYTCNTGYELTGSNTRTCQSNGSWSGSDDVCRRAKVTSSSLAATVSTDTTATTTTTTTTTVTPYSTYDGDDDAQTGDDHSSFGGAFITGCVVGIVMCITIVAVVILLLLFRKRRRKNNSTQGVVHYVSSEGKESTDGKEFSEHQYSVIADDVAYEPTVDAMVTIKDTDYELIDNHGNNSIATNNSNTHNEAMPYMDPIITTVKSHSKYSNNDYEALPALHMYDKPDQLRADAPYQYEIVAPSVFRDSMMDEVLPDDELIYEDPGHKKEEIYSWFEEKKFLNIRKSDIKISQELGSGEFGVVHLGLWSNGSADPVQVAVKTSNSQCSESDRVKFLREAAIMGQFVHNNVVQLHGVVTEEKNIMIVLEYMPKGDLHEFLIKLKTSTPMGECNELKHDLLSFCRQIAAGMNYLANKQFVHRDLAARNILVSSDDVCKIADFGMARDVSDDTYYITRGGKIPVRWSAPEALFYKKYSAQSDAWNFGCVMYEIWSLGHKPFEDHSGKEYIEKITSGYRLPPPPGCPRAIYELMIQCWHPTARDRPTSGSISRTLQKSDRALLTSSTQVGDDDVTKDNQSMMLGAPLTAGSQLYLDLQQRYVTK